MDVLESIFTRRSTRQYQTKEVPKELVDKIVEAGRFAPSGGNSQTTHFFVITNKELLFTLEEMVKNAFASMEETPGMYKSKVGSIRAAKSGTYFYDYKAPVLIVTANKMDYGNNIADCACALENMMLTANAFDLGSCWINQLRWLNEDEALLAKFKELGLKEDERIYGALAVGYADTKDGLPMRLELKRTGNEVTVLD